MEPALACAVQCVCPARVQSAVERSARTVHASTGGRLRAGPSFLAKVDLLIGRWPGWEGGTHLCSRCSSPPFAHHVKPASISVAAHCYLVGRWPASGAQLLRSSTTEVSSCAAVDFAGPWPKLDRVRVGLRWSLQTSKDEEEGASPPPGILRSSRWFR